MSRRIPTQQDIREQGLCVHGFNYGGPAGQPIYCGEPSEPDAPFGDCPQHAEKSRALVTQFFGGAAEAIREAGQ